MDFSARQKRFQQTLQDERLDGFVVTHPANLRYLCGYTGSNGLLLFLGGRRTFSTDGRYTQQAREQVQGARIVISKGALIKDAAAMMSKLRSAAIGFEADLTTVAAANQMCELTPKRIRWKPTSGLVMRQRLIKDPEELKLIKAAVQLGAKAYRDALKSLRPGVTAV
jgi:Xaa-Pro aminopeptidase